MSTNKHPLTRYQALDRCFSNRFRNYAIWDLLQACNDALYEATADNRYKIDARRYHDNHAGIKKRQIYLDIEYMKSDAGWSVEIEKFRNANNEQCYRYADPDFSINKSPLTAEEFDHLKQTILLLNRFHGMPQFEWMADVLTRLENNFSLRGTDRPVMGFDQNVDLVGLGHLKDLFGFITQRQPLQVNYQPIGRTRRLWTIHPYYLKEYNNRWFLLGWCDEESRIHNLALDRIESFQSAFIPYRENTTIDFEEYFDDVIGVTIPRSAPIEKVVLKFSPSRYPYVMTKPLHLTQRNLNSADRIIEISVKINPELITQILSFGNDVEVLEPLQLRNQIKERILKAFELYNTQE